MGKRDKEDQLLLASRMLVLPLSTGQRKLPPERLFQGNRKEIRVEIAGKMEGPLRGKLWLEYDSNRGDHACSLIPILRVVRDSLDNSKSANFYLEKGSKIRGYCEFSNVSLENLKDFSKKMDKLNRPRNYLFEQILFHMLTHRKYS